MSFSAATTAARAAMNAARPVLLPPWGAGAGTTPSPKVKVQSCTPLLNSSTRGFATLSASATTATPVSLSALCTPILNGPATGQQHAPSGARSTHRLVAHTPTLDLLQENAAAATSASSEKVAAAAISTAASMAAPRHTVPQWGMFFHEAHVDVTTPFKQEMPSVGTTIDAATAIDAAEASATTPLAADEIPQWSMFFQPAAPQFRTALAMPKNSSSSNSSSSSIHAQQHRTMATTSTPASAAAMAVTDMSAPAEWEEFSVSCDSRQVHEPTPGPAVSGANNEHDPVSAAILHEKNEWSQFWHDPTWHPENTNTAATDTASSNTQTTAIGDAASPAKANATAVDQMYMDSVLGLAPSLDTTDNARLRPLQTCRATPTEAAGVSLASSASVLCFGILAGGSGSVLGVASAVPIF